MKVGSVMVIITLTITAVRCPSLALYQYEAHVVSGSVSYAAVFSPALHRCGHLSNLAELTLLVGNRTWTQACPTPAPEGGRGPRC